MQSIIEGMLDVTQLQLKGKPYIRRELINSIQIYTEQRALYHVQSLRALGDRHAKHSVSEQGRTKV
jgi:hypothetical protein